MTRRASRAAAVWWCIAATGALALAVEWLALRPLAPASPSASVYVPLLAVGAGFAVAELAVVHVRVGRNAYAYSLSEIPLVLGLHFVRLDLLVVSRLLGGLVAFAWRRRTRVQKMAFNVALFALEASVAAVVWQLVLGGADAVGPRGWLAACTAVLSTGLLTSSLVSVVIALDTGTVPSVRGEVFGLGPVGDLVNAVFALVVVYVLVLDWRAAWMVVVVVVVLAGAYRGYERLHARTENLERLNRFTGQVGGQLRVDAVVRAVLLQIRDAGYGEVVELTLDGDPDGAADRPGGGSGGRPGDRRWILAAGSTVPTDAQPGAGIAAAVAPWLAAGSLVVPRHTHDAALARTLADLGLKDIVAVPLHREGAAVGALVVADRPGDVGTFTEQDRRQLEALANHASVALENADRADLLRRQAAQREFQATHDELTGLANRRLFDRQLAAAQRDHAATAVLLLDLDRFKEINDTLGHHTGDDLLRLVAARLREAVPAGGTVARFGGDEFGVLLPGADPHTAMTCASWLRGALSRTFELGDLTVAVDGSIGVAVTESVTEGAGADALVRRADVAMYVAKAARSGVELYRPELDRYNPERVTLLADLRDAVTRGALTVAYQPKVELADGRVGGVEALVRWDHPRLGPVPPDEFIAIAEHSGLITPLTMLVLLRALSQHREWREKGAVLDVAVNLSPRSLLDPGFVDEVAGALAASGVPAGVLTLEITETSLMAEPERAIDALHRLHDLGVHLSVDDLGTGYSSLSYLQRLPVDEIKIDRSFLAAMAEPAAEAVVGAIVDLGHRLGRRVVAEGVEDAYTWERLRALGCEAAQGYWMSPPLPGPDVTAWLADWRARHAPSLRVVG